MICPNCQVDVAISEQLYGGLYTCGSCQAAYFISFEGQPEFGEVPTGVLSDIITEPPAQASEISIPTEIKYDSPFDASLDPPVDAVDMVDFDKLFRYMFGGISFLYGGWRIYRGYKKEYFR